MNVLDVRTLPVLRIVVGEFGKPPQQRLPRLDHRGLEEPGALLHRPPVQHRIEHRRLRIQMRDAVCEDAVGDTGAVRRDGHDA